MNIAVIGTGWLGHPLATKLTELGHIVYGSRRSVPAAQQVAYKTFVHPSENPLNGEILSRADVVVLAFPPDRSAREKYANDCLQICRQTAAHCRILLVSSTGVYPDIDGLCMETHFDDVEFAPDHPVARAEYELIRSKGSHLTIVRLAGLIGPNRHPVRSMSASGKTYKGNEHVNVIHQQDAVDLIVFLIENKVRGEIVNGCAAEHPKRESYYSWMAQELGIQPPAFEQYNGEGKLVSSEKSRAMGFSYTYDNPFDFLGT